MADDIAAFKAALQKVMALADRALDAKLQARKPKPVPPPEEEMEPEQPEEDDALSPEDEEELAALYGKE